MSLFWREEAAAVSLQPSFKTSCLKIKQSFYLHTDSSRVSLFFIPLHSLCLKQPGGTQEHFSSASFNRFLHGSPPAKVLTAVVISRKTLSFNHLGSLSRLWRCSVSSVCVCVSERRCHKPVMWALTSLFGQKLLGLICKDTVNSVSVYFSYWLHAAHIIQLHLDHTWDPVAMQQLFKTIRIIVCEIHCSLLRD